MKVGPELLPSPLIYGKKARERSAKLTKSHRMKCIPYVQYVVSMFCLKVEGVCQVFAKLLDIIRGD